MKHIGFIGASGLMGHGMARNLLAKGFAVSLTVHRNKDGVADLLSAGARQVARPADLGACDAVILCVTGTPQVEAALLGPDGVLSRARPGLVVIDTSTSEPESTQRLGAQCALQGVTLVDAPLAGLLSRLRLENSIPWWALRQRYLRRSSRCCKPIAKTSFTWVDLAQAMSSSC